MEIRRSQAAEITKGYMPKKHVYLLASISPQLRISRLVWRPEEEISHALLQELAHLSKKHWGLCAREYGCFCYRSRNVR